MKLRLIFTLIIMFLCTSCKTIKDFPQSNYPPYYNSINMEYNGKNYSQHGKILDNLPEGFELVSNDITKKMFKNQANLYINDNTPFYVYVGYSVNGETEYHQWRRSEGGTFKVCYNDCIYTCEGSVNRYDLPESLTQAGYILGCTQNKTPTQQLFADTDAVLGLNVYETVDTKTLYVEVWAETEYKVLKISEHIKENSTSYIEELSNVTAEVRINSSDTESLKESNVAEAIKIVKECIEKSEDICSILDGKVTYILDEEGKNIFYNDSFEWIEIESDYSIEEIGTKLSDCLTGNLLNYYKYVLENHYMQDNGHLYIRATDSAIRDADYYFETLTVLEQQENFLSVRFDGFDNNYEQQIFVTAELVFEDDCWKLSVLSHI